jgi:hypothetical protein
MNAETLTIEQLQNAVEKLPQEKLAEFRHWFEEFAADRWDEQIEADIKAGKWDAHAEAALAEHKAGLTRKL